MLKVFGVVVAAVLVSTKGSTGVMTHLMSNDRSEGFSVADTRDPLDVNALLAAAKGAPTMICALAAQSIGNNWGNWSDAPATPLKSVSSTESDYDFRSDALSTSDIQTLLQALSSDDPCVRELSVRVVTRRKSDTVVSGLVSRLSAESAPLREVASLGLGLAHSATSIDPLIRTLKDGVPAVRANSAWALGRLQAGRALTPLMGLFNDDAESVRLAAVGAVGRIDSTRSVPTLIRVVKQDASPSVRRVVWRLTRFSPVLRRGSANFAASMAWIM